MYEKKSFVSKKNYVSKKSIFKLNHNMKTSLREITKIKSFRARQLTKTVLK